MESSTPKKISSAMRTPSLSWGRDICTGLSHFSFWFLVRLTCCWAHNISCNNLMSYVAPCFCADRVTPYPREGAILAQATDCSNLQHNLFHLDFVFTNAVYGTTMLKKNIMPDFKWLQAHINHSISDIPGNR